MQAQPNKKSEIPVLLQANIVLLILCNKDLSTRGAFQLLRNGLSSFSELEPGTACCFSERLDTALVLEATPVEDYLCDVLVKAFLGNITANHLCCIQPPSFFFALVAFLHFSDLIQVVPLLGCSSAQGNASSNGVIDYVHVNVMQRPENRHPRPSGASLDLAADGNPGSKPLAPSNSLTPFVWGSFSIGPMLDPVAHVVLKALPGSA